MTRPSWFAGAAMALLLLSARPAAALQAPGRTYTASEAWAYRDDIKKIDVSKYAAVSTEQQRQELSRLIGECDTTIGFLGDACRKAGELRDKLDQSMKDLGDKAAEQECSQPMDADAARDASYVEARKKRCDARSQQRLQKEIADKKLDAQKCDAYQSDVSAASDKDYDHMVDLCRLVYEKQQGAEKKAKLLGLAQDCNRQLKAALADDKLDAVAKTEARKTIAACAQYDQQAGVPTQAEQAKAERERLAEKAKVDKALADGDAWKAEQKAKWGFVPHEDTFRIQSAMKTNISDEKQDALRQVFKYSPAAALNFAKQAGACDAKQGPDEARCRLALRKRYEALADGKPLRGKTQGEDRADFAYACQKLPAAAAGADDPDAGLRAKCGAYTKAARSAAPTRRPRAGLEGRRGSMPAGCRARS